MKLKLIRVSAWVALCGLGVELLGFARAVSLWNQSHPEPYNFLNNFVSELGAPKNSAMARVFSGTLILAGLLIAPNVYALGARIKTRLGYAGMVSGFCAGLGTVGAGIFSMDACTLFPHLVAAMMLFWGTLFAVFLFTLAFWRRNSFMESPAVIIAGIVACAVIAIFIAVLCHAVGSFFASGGRAMTGAVSGDPVKSLAGFHRPRVWDIAVLEWCVVAAIFWWNLLVSLYLLRLTTPCRSRANRGATIAE